MNKSQAARTRIERQLQDDYDMQPDRWGNYKFISVMHGTEFRLKFQRQTIRLEQSVAGSWKRLKTRTYIQTDNLAEFDHYLAYREVR